MRTSVNLLSLSNIINIETGVIASIGAASGPILTKLYGEGRTAILILFFVVILHDWVMGIWASIKDKTYSSEYGIKGVFRTLYICTYPALGNLIDLVLGTPGFLFHAVTFGLIYHYWKSGMANATRAGLDKWIPDFVTKLIESEIRAKAIRAMERQTYLEDRIAMLQQQNNEKNEGK
jgi:phage-related holin